MEKLANPRAPSTLLYALLFSFLTYHSLYYILAHWKWTDTIERGHIIKLNSMNNYDRHTWMKQDKCKSKIRSNSVLTVT